MRVVYGLAVFLFMILGSFLVGESFRNNYDAWIILWMLSPFVAWVSTFIRIKNLLGLNLWRIIYAVLITGTCYVSFYSFLEPRYLVDFLRERFEGSGSLLVYMLEILIPIFTWLFMSKVIQEDNK